MMQALRRSTKTIMIIVAAAFVIGFIFLQLGVNVTGSGNSPTVKTLGSVNGVEIDYQLYNDTRSQLLMQIKQQKGTITDEDYMRVEEQVWDEIVYQILLQQEIEKLGIRVTDEEVLEEMKNNPPDFLKTNETFLTDGQFDQTKYLQALYSPQNEQFVIELEGYYRTVLPMQKLQDYLLSTIHITDDEIKTEYRDRNDKVKAAYLAFTPSMIKPEDVPGVTDEEIRAYYRDNKEDYSIEKRVVLEYISFPVVPNREDTLEAKTAIEEVQKQLADGTPFEELAKTYSQDPASAEKGGDLGWVRKGRMVKPVEEAAFALEKGEVSEPVLSQFGYHLIKLEDRRESKQFGEEVWIRHILIKLEPSYLTVSDISDSADAIREACVTQGDIYHVADSLGLDVETSEPLSRGQYIPAFGSTAIPARYGFTHPVGEISDVMKFGDVYTFFKVKSSIPAGYQDLEAVRDEIRKKLTEQKELEELRAVAGRALDRCRETGGLQAAADEFGVERKETGMITRRSIVQGVGRYSTFTGVAFGLPAGEISGLVETPSGIYVLKVLEKADAAEQEFADAKEKIRQEMMTYRQNTVMNNWYEAVKSQADIVDNRELFFQQTS
jgi:peptidyl-prolyl cis-trans isomerase D